MEKIRILTTDERLRREILLLLPKDHTVSSDADTSLLILDVDTVSSFAPRCGERVLRITRFPSSCEGEVLPRPFSFDGFYAALQRARDTAPTLFLTATEEKLFQLLRDAHGESVSRERLIREVWGEDGNDGLLNLYIHYLREKLEKDGKRRIYAARGKGYFYKC